MKQLFRIFSKSRKKRGKLFNYWPDVLSEILQIIWLSNHWLALRMGSPFDSLNRKYPSCQNSFIERTQKKPSWRFPTIWQNIFWWQTFTLLPTRTYDEMDNFLWCVQRDQNVTKSLWENVVFWMIELCRHKRNLVKFAPTCMHMGM
jgi:hypothetical protein